MSERKKVSFKTTKRVPVKVNVSFETKPKPLDLKISDSFRKELKEHLHFTDLTEDEKEELINSFLTEIIDFVERRIKSAYEFYLRYKDKPELLIEEHPEFKEEVEKLESTPNPYFEFCKTKEGKRMLGENISCKECERWVRKECEKGEFILKIHSIFIRDYNTWLFKLVFKDIFENEVSQNANGKD